MEKVDIFDQEVGRAAIECNGNLVVVSMARKHFGSRNKSRVCKRASRSTSSTLCVCVTVSKVGEPCKYKSTGNSFSFVARSVSRREALSEY